MENSPAALDTTAAPDHGRVPRKRVSMRKTREILRLRHELKLSQRQIADALFLSAKTIEIHVSRILDKLGASTRGEAVAIARRSGQLGAAD